MKDARSLPLSLRCLPQVVIHFCVNTCEQVDPARELECKIIPGVDVVCRYCKIRCYYGGCFLRKPEHCAALSEDALRAYDSLVMVPRE